MEVTGSTKRLHDLISSAFELFYRELRNDPYLLRFFEKVDMKQLQQKQCDNFTAALQESKEEVLQRFAKLGKMHYEMGLPYSRYIKSFQTLLKSIYSQVTVQEDTLWLVEKIQQFFDYAIEGSALGYLQQMLEYDTQVIQKLLKDSIAEEFVNEHLLWIEQVCSDIQHKRSRPSVQIDHTRCALGRWLSSPRAQELLCSQDMEHIRSMHYKIHSTAQSVYDALAKEDYHSLLLDYIFLVRHSQHINFELNQLVTQKDLIHASETDSLTGLPNRKRLEKMLQKLKLYADRYDIPFCIAMIDLDYFKKINDTHGHLVGDMVLEQTAAILQSHLRKSDSVIRYGGEEFLLSINGATLKESFTLLEKLRTAISEHIFFYKDTPIRLSVSIGTVQYDTASSPSLQELIAQADKALYEAKEQGRNRVVAYRSGS